MLFAICCFLATLTTRHGGENGGDGDKEGVSLVLVERMETRKEVGKRIFGDDGYLAQSYQIYRVE